MADEREMTEEQKAVYLKRRRARSIAIGAVLALLVVIFYAITVAKLGPDVLVRDI
ncbi:MAG TPA: hypothetical protein VNS12_14125 [Pelagibacterium sp.]|uniref:hypothetical protein n=1 Tax=Pelagibacterium sp. TaxID=1967288 RepID=UPI002C4EDDB5|nr:hypothetical protein [Pelagibacterium sp.]HWJ89199.1 hypothetical protein [Pelagibacterium sp.]